MTVILPKCPTLDSDSWMNVTVARISTATSGSESGWSIVLGRDTKLSSSTRVSNVDMPVVDGATGAEGVAGRTERSLDSNSLTRARSCDLLRTAHQSPEDSPTWETDVNDSDSLLWALPLLAGGRRVLVFAGETELDTSETTGSLTIAL